MNRNSTIHDYLTSVLFCALELSFTKHVFVIIYDVRLVYKRKALNVFPLRVINNQCDVPNRLQLRRIRMTSQTTFSLYKQALFIVCSVARLLLLQIVASGPNFIKSNLLWMYLQVENVR